MDSILKPTFEWAKEKNIFFLEAKISQSNISIEIEKLNQSDFHNLAESLSVQVLFFEPKFFKIPKRLEFEFCNEPDLFSEFEKFDGKLKLYKLFFVKDGCLYIFKLPSSLYKNGEVLYEKWKSIKEDHKLSNDIKRSIIDEEIEEWEVKTYNIAKDIIDRDLFTYQDYCNMSLTDIYGLVKANFNEDVLSLDNYHNKNILNIKVGVLLYENIKKLYKDKNFERDEKVLISKIKELKSQKMSKLEIGSRLNLKSTKLNELYYRD
jgi:hypothetical protein